MGYTGGALFAGLAVNTVGFSLSLYGRKVRRLPHAAGGGVLMVLPFVLEGAAAQLAAGVLVGAGVWYATRAGV